MIGFVALAVAAGALLAWPLPSSNRALLVTAALSPYLMLGAPLALVLFALAQQWAWVAAATALTAAAVATQLPRHLKDPAPAAGTSIRLVSANLHLGRVAPEAVVTLAHQHADVLVAQELTPELAAALSGLDEAFPHSLLRPAEWAAGVGLWSRHPITARGSDDSFSRGLIAARIRVPGTETEPTVVCTHMPPPRSGFLRWRHEMTRLGRAVHALAPEGPVMIGADLNATPDVFEFRGLLRHGWRDGTAQAGAGQGRSYPTHHRGIPPLIAIDHVLTRGAVATSVRTLELVGSDHRALAATVVFG